MELTLTVVFGLFSIHLSVAAETPTVANTDGHVLFYSQHDELFTGMVQDTTMSIKPVDSREYSTQFTIQLTKDASKHLFVECVEDEKRPEVFLYSQEGILVDKLTLRNSEDVCKRVKDYISLDGKEPEIKTFKNKYDVLEFSLMYQSHEEQHCFIRSYVINYLFYVALLGRDKVLKIKCKEDSVTDFAKGEAAGVINVLTKEGFYEIMDYIKGSPRSDPIVSTFAVQGFKLKCQEYTMERKQDAIKASTMASGLIMHDYLVIDRLFLDSCTTGVEGIYIGELRESSKASILRIVFKKSGDCFSREIKFTRPKIIGDTLYHMWRSTPMRVRCQNDWISGKELKVEELP
ncbi:uncharacterized protein LOC129003139 [Macrosteles quadrilineatus]|uniref:uncharacterized protein LOC129003139 n=1 Tax=Macrosteles quadrilineatus TaxID=74068 RepID=UPI0023E328DF|nr:uncharacterized protein LOC129003139 [Macrosteles quadrilineatus]